MSELHGVSSDPSIPGVLGENTPGVEGGRGVVGNGFTATGVGVLGQNTLGVGVFGNSTDGRGVVGHSTNQAGVAGDSDNLDGVQGITRSATAAGVIGVNSVAGGRGVVGNSTNTSGTGTGVLGQAVDGDGVFGNSTGGRGVVGHSTNQAGVVGDSDSFDGVFGVSRNLNAAGVSGHNPGGLAGFFEGNVTVTGDILLQNADCSEDFDIAALEGVEPGSVMVIGHDSALRQSEQAYDTRVAGVVSGSGDYKPGIVLDRREQVRNRKSIALLGKVYCKVDASYRPIEVGDLLTTSDTPGHAMKATDQFKAFGAVIGKALRPWCSGRGLIPILIALQ